MTAIDGQHLANAGKPERRPGGILIPACWHHDQRELAFPTDVMIACRGGREVEIWNSRFLGRVVERAVRQIDKIDPPGLPPEIAAVEVAA
jgi:hypothetical protein